MYRPALHGLTTQEAAAWKATPSFGGEPDVDRWGNGQGSRRPNRNRVGASVVAGAIVVVAVASMLGRLGGRNPQALTGATPTATSATPTGPSAVDPGPFLLDLRTGERRPLPANLAGGYYYRASPDGTRIVYNGCCSTTDEMRLANVDGTHVRTLGSPEGLSFYGARWSPDGSKLLYQQREPGSLDLGNLFVQDLDGPRRTRLTDVTLPWAQWWFISAGFSPDGRHVIYHLPRGRPVATTWDVWSVPVGGGESRLVLRNGSFPEYFPDGEHIAFLSQATTDAVRGHFGGRRIAVASVDDPHSRRTLVRSNGLIWWPAMSPDGSRIAYQVDGTIYVLDVATGDSSPVAFGELADWFDDDALIVNPG